MAPTGRPAPARSRLRVTPLGWGVLVAVVVLLTGARLLRYTDLAVLGGTGAAAIVLALATSTRRPRVAVAVSVVPHRVVRGEPATLVLALQNQSPWSSPPFALVVPARTEPPARAGSGGPGTPASPDLVLHIPRLGGAQARTFSLELRTSARGVVMLGPADVVRSDPFGLVIRRQTVAAAARLHVRPAVQALAALASAPSREPDGQTGHGTSGGLDIHTLRPYTAGEELRTVHWLSSARAGELMVRTHVDPTEPAATVVLDVRPAAYPPGQVGEAVFEDAVDVAAAAVMTCARESFGVRLVTTAGLRASGRRRRQDADMLLDELAGVRLDDDGSLDVVGTLRRGGLGTLVLVTGGFDREAPAALAPVAHAYGRVVLVRVGPRSVATARAVGRRDSSDRARLRPLPSARARAGAGRGRAAAAGRRRGETTTPRIAGRLTVIDIPGATELADHWPASGRPGPGIAMDGVR